MSHLTELVIGTVTGGACLALALPTLFWYLPSKRRPIFARSTDPRALFQLGFGLVCMAMAFADALCRFIPHRQLDLVHPVFLLTTAALAAFVAPKLYRAARGSAARAAAPAGLAVLLAVFVTVPLGVVIHAFLT